MLKLSSMKVEVELRSYCQRWLSLLSEGEFDQACEMISAPNKYGVRWCKEEIIESTADYFGDLKDFAVQNMDIADCTPEFLAYDDGSYLLGFYFPVNGEITDLTVEFEFNRIAEDKFSATINYIHVL